MSIQIMIINILFTQKYYMEPSSSQASMLLLLQFQTQSNPPLNSRYYNAKFLNYLRSKASKAAV